MQGHITDHSLRKGNVAHDPTERTEPTSNQGLRDPMVSAGKRDRQKYLAHGWLQEGGGSHNKLKEAGSLSLASTISSRKKIHEFSKKLMFVAPIGW